MPHKQVPVADPELAKAFQGCSSRYAMARKVCAAIKQLDLPIPRHVPLVKDDVVIFDVPTRIDDEQLNQLVELLKEPSDQSTIIEVRALTKIR